MADVNNTKATTVLKEEYKDYTLGLALFDAVPVLIFLMSGIVIYTMFDSPVFLAGAAASFLGGMSKVIWKTIIVLRKRDYPVLTKAFRVLMFGGFGLMLLSVVLRAGQGAFASLGRSLTMMPACIFFALGIAGMCLMGYLGSHMDNSARANWIEEAVNTAAQTAVLIGVILVYFGTYYHATDAAMTALESTDTVAVTEAEEYYLFDGPGSENAVVFYQGAKVAPEAYAPLMMRLAQDGTDCFLCKMPANFALLGKNMATEIRGEYKADAASAPNDTNVDDSGSAAAERENDYDNWYLAGHSLGGAVASMLAADTSAESSGAEDATDSSTDSSADSADNDDCADSSADSASPWSGIIFLASYPTDELDIPALSIYGSDDEVLNHDKYEEADDLWPAGFTESVIQGGNHAQFGSYGEQKGDGTASISGAAQLDKTAAVIASWLLNQ